MPRSGAPKGVFFLSDSGPPSAELMAAIVMGLYCLVTFVCLLGVLKPEQRSTAAVSRKGSLNRDENAPSPGERRSKSGQISWRERNNDEHVKPCESLLAGPIPAAAAMPKDPEISGKCDPLAPLGPRMAWMPSGHPVRGISRSSRARSTSWRSSFAVRWAVARTGPQAPDSAEGLVPRSIHAVASFGCGRRRLSRHRPLLESACSQMRPRCLLGRQMVSGRTVTRMTTSAI